MPEDTRLYSEFALIDLLDAFASNTPVPGGGSAAALAGALGVSLLVMAASLPKSRTGAPEEAADLAEAAARLRPLRDTLVQLETHLPLVRTEEMGVQTVEYFDEMIRMKIVIRYVGDAKFKGVRSSFPVYDVDSEA